MFRVWGWVGDLGFRVRGLGLGFSKDLQGFHKCSMVLEGLHQGYERIIEMKWNP